MAVALLVRCDREPLQVAVVSGGAGDRKRHEPAPEQPGAAEATERAVRRRGVTDLLDLGRVVAPRVAECGAIDRGGCVLVSAA